MCSAPSSSCRGGGSTPTASAGSRPTEAEHFGRDPAARRVADATLGLMLTFHPRVPGRLVHAFARAMMDPPLREAFGYAAPPAPLEWLAHRGLRARGLALRAFPARRRPKLVADLAWVRSYPDGYRVEELGTFPSGGGCPVGPAPPAVRRPAETPGPGVVG